MLFNFDQITQQDTFNPVFSFHPYFHYYLTLLNQLKDQHLSTKQQKLVDKIAIK